MVTPKPIKKKALSGSTTPAATTPVVPGIQGNQFPIGLGLSRARRYNLPVPEVPIRPINGDLALSYDLIEMNTWCYESRHGLRRLAEDCFQQLSGEVGSWAVAGVLHRSPSGKSERAPLNPEVEAVGNSLQQRRDGKKYVLGGNRLIRAARECLAYGDSFVELGFEKEGIGRNDWGITSSLYLPAMSVFVEENDHGTLLGYSQRARMQPSQDDIHLEPSKVMHFCLDEQGQYGQGLLMQSLEPWREVKERVIDLAEASRSAALNPLLHIMPPNRDNAYKDAYKREYQSLKNGGLIGDMFLLSGADVKRASGVDQSKGLEALVGLWMKWR